MWSTSEGVPFQTCEMVLMSALVADMWNARTPLTFPARVQELLNCMQENQKGASWQEDEGGASSCTKDDAPDSR